MIKNCFPKGKYNGLPIVGIEFQLKIRLDSWLWLPKCNWQKHYGEPYFHWLILWTWIRLVYGYPFNSK